MKWAQIILCPQAVVGHPLSPNCEATEAFLQELGMWEIISQNHWPTKSCLAWQRKNTFYIYPEQPRRLYILREVYVAIAVQSNH